MIKSIYAPWLMLLALILLAGCGAPQPVNNSAEAQAGIETTLEQWMASFENGDAAGIAACYTTDALLMPPNGETVSGQAGVREVFQGYIDAGLNIKLKVTEVEGYGNTACEIGVATVLGPDGETLDVSKYMVIWKKTGETWKMHRDIWNSNSPRMTNDEQEMEDAG